MNRGDIPEQIQSARTDDTEARKPLPVLKPRPNTAAVKPHIPIVRLSLEETASSDEPNVQFKKTIDWMPLSHRSVVSSISSEAGMPENVVNENYGRLLNKFYVLCLILKIPQLDTVFYKKVDALIEHKERTIKVIVNIKEREKCLARMRRLIRTHNPTQKHDLLALQKRGLMILKDLQLAGLRVVDSILKWRETLTRPYGFSYKKTDNYLLKMRTDYEFIENSTIASYLPRFNGKVLLSSCPSLGTELNDLMDKNLGQLKQAANPSGLFTTTPKTTPVIGFNMEKSMHDVGTHMITKEKKPGENKLFVFLRRLRRAEFIIEHEEKVQEKILDNLQNLVIHGRFVPIIDTSNVVVNCKHGLPLQRGFVEQYQRRIKQLFGTSSNESYTPSSTTSSSIGGHRQKMESQLQRDKQRIDDSDTSGSVSLRTLSPPPQEEESSAGIDSDEDYDYEYDDQLEKEKEEEQERFITELRKKLDQNRIIESDEPNYESRSEEETVEPEATVVEAKPEPLAKPIEEDYEDFEDEHEEPNSGRGFAFGLDHNDDVEYADF